MANLLDLKITRTAKGTRLYAKSPVIANYIRTLSNGTVRGMYGGTPTYGVAARALMANGAVFNPNVPLLYNGAVNLSFLTLLGLEGGVSIDLPEVHSNASIEVIQGLVGRAVASLYNMQIREIEFEMTLEMVN